jgi:hypothetical protein
MVNIARTIRGAVLSLGLLGSAALAGLGPLGAHAAPSNSIRSLNLPTLQTVASNCGAYITGSHFTPGGVVDLYVYGNGVLLRTFKEYPVWLPLWGAVPGTFSQTVFDSVNATYIEAVAYDEAAHEWSYWSGATEYCLQ